MENTLVEPRSFVLGLQFSLKLQPLFVEITISCDREYGKSALLNLPNLDSLETMSDGDSSTRGQTTGNKCAVNR